MLMRRETLVQLDDELLAALDERAQRQGTSRSALIREAVESYLRDHVEAALDHAIVRGYERVTAVPPADLERLLAVASIEQEPW